MRKRLFTIFKYILFLGGGIFLVWWQFHKMTPEQEDQFMYALSDADYRVMVPVIIMSLLSHLSRAQRWRILMEPMGYRPSLFNAFSVTMAGYLANSFFPRLGEILKCTLLGRYENIPIQKLIGTIVVERIFDFACFLGFVVITVLIQYKLVGNFVKERLAVMSGEGTAFPLWAKAAIAAGCLLFIVLLLRWLFKKYTESKPVLRIRNFVKGLGEGIATIKNLQKKQWFVFHTVFIWSMYLLQIYVGFFAIKEVAHLGPDAACAVLTLATLAMIATPGGLGTFPPAVALVLVLYNVKEATGEAFGWLMWGTTTFIILVFGSLFLGLLLYVNRKKKEASIVNRES